MRRRGQLRRGRRGGTVFVVSQVHGIWGQARQVPGMAALDKGGSAVISAASCGSAGNCAAGGYYTGRSGNAGAFVVSQVHGIWGQALEVPGHRSPRHRPRRRDRLGVLPRSE